MKEKPLGQILHNITYIRTLEGFAYLAVVIDLYSRRVVGLLDADAVRQPTSSCRRC